MDIKRYTLLAISLFSHVLFAGQTESVSENVQFSDKDFTFERMFSVGSDKIIRSIAVGNDDSLVVFIKHKDINKIDSTELWDVVTWERKKCFDTYENLESKVGTEVRLNKVNDGVEIWGGKDAGLIKKVFMNTDYVKTCKVTSFAKKFFLIVTRAKIKEQPKRKHTGDYIEIYDGETGDQQTSFFVKEKLVCSLFLSRDLSFVVALEAKKTVWAGGEFPVGGAWISVYAQNIDAKKMFCIARFKVPDIIKIKDLGGTVRDVPITEIKSIALSNKNKRIMIATLNGDIFVFKTPHQMHNEKTYYSQGNGHFEQYLEHGTYSDATFLWDEIRVAGSIPSFDRLRMSGAIARQSDGRKQNVSKDKKRVSPMVRMRHDSRKSPQKSQ